MRILFVIYCIPLFLLAQTNENKHSMEWNTNLLFESNSLDKSFLNTMLYGGYITNSIKNNWINAVENKNVFYYEISNGLSYTLERNSHSFGFSCADRNILNTRFSEDLLRLVFEGNYNYQDNSLFFNNTSIRADRFQQYKIRYATTFVNANIHGSVSYLSGNHHFSYMLEKGSLYTAPFGTSLDIEYNISAFITDTSNFSAFVNNGSGIAIDLGSDFNIKKHNIHLSITDLGFILWSPSSISLAIDSNFSFQGIEVEDILSFNDSVLEANNIRNDVLKTNNTSFKSYIPATFHFKVSGNSDYKYLKNYTFGIQGKWQPYLDNTPLSFSKIGQGFKESNFKTLYYTQSVFSNKFCNFIPTLSYGGYSSNTNLGLALSKGKKHNFTIGTHHLEDVLKSSSAKAVSVYFNIKFQF